MIDEGRPLPTRIGVMPGVVDERERLASAVAGTEEIGPIGSWRRIGEGWNRDTYLVNDGWIVQFPKAEDVRDKLRKEIGFLERLKPFLSVETPTVQLLSDDPFCVAYPVLAGEQALFNRSVALPGAWPEQLGITLSELHRVSPTTVGLEPAPPVVWQQTCRVWFDRLLKRVLPLLPAMESDVLSNQVRRFMAELDLGFPPSVIHRDIGPEHILLSDAGDLVAIIDWAEVMIGDPAIDFSWLIDRWPAQAEQALSRYGPQDDAFRKRAKMYAQLGPWYEVTHGLETSDDALVNRALARIRRGIRTA
jgi:aminoglycoside phosphotransferase (APT) family kinase protein